MLDLRNLIEHPKPGKSAKVFDFRQTAGAQLMVPSVERRQSQSVRRIRFIHHGIAE
jgi:hypothetical protein